MTAKTPAQRQADHYLRKVKAGFKQVSVWVPANKVKALQEWAKKLMGTKP